MHSAGMMRPFTYSVRMPVAKCATPAISTLLFCRAKDLPPAFFAELAETIEESTIPYEVDLVDLREVSPAFREQVIRSGIKWRG
jgi:serine/threonine protein kinase HipA of HipAB toxin-antitoxin module